MPAFNRREPLKDALRCVLVQDVDLEVIVVDDGSVADVGGVVRALGDRRVRYVRQPNRGVCASRNTGLGLAQHPWVAFADDDDLWAPGKLRHQLAALRRVPGARWCISSAAITDFDLNLLMLDLASEPDEVCRSIHGRNLVPGGGSGVVVETGLLRQLGGFDTSLTQIGDWEMWTRLARIGTPAVVRKPMVIYRRHAGQESRKIARAREELRRLALRGRLADHVADDYLAPMGSMETRSQSTATPPLTRALFRRALLRRQEEAYGVQPLRLAAIAIAEVRAVLAYD